MSTSNPASNQDIITAIRQVVSPGPGPVGLHEPRFVGREWDYVKECLDTGWVSSVGSFVDRFERSLADICGVPNVLATVNGTCALHLAMHVLGVRPGDEVVTPALSFVATANAVAHCGAVPHFADCDGLTLGVDPHRLRAHLRDIGERSNDGLVNRLTGRRIVGVICTHIFGHPALIDELVDVCAEYGLPLIEDAAEALGSRWQGRHLGGFGTVAALSFNGNKIVTTGGGGALLTHDAALAKRLRHVGTTAKQAHPWCFDHDQVAFNYRLPNINAALGCAQLECLDDFLAAKRALAARYRQALSGVPGVSVMIERDGAIANYWLNTLVFDQPGLDRRDALLSDLHAQGLQARPIWTLLSDLPMYRDCPRMALDVAARTEASLVNLPSSVRLGVDLA